MSDRPMHTIPGAFQRLQQLYAEGEALVDQNRLEEAVAKFTEGLGIDDHFRQRYVTMYAQRAFALQKLGRPAEAAADYSKAIEMEPPINQAQYHFHRGMCFAGMEGGAERAVQDYTQSIALHADHPGPYHLRGKLLADVFHEYERAIADFDKLLSMRPNPDALMWRGISKYELKRFAEARADFEASNEMTSNGHNHYMLACIGAVTNDDRLLVRGISGALAMDPDYATCFREDEEFAMVRNRPEVRRLIGG